MTPRGRTFFARRMRKHFFVIACVSLALITVVTRCAVLVMRRRAGVDARHARFRAITDHVDRTFRLSERELTLDSSGAYVVHSDVNDGVDAVGAHDVTAVTHCTAANLAYLPRLVHAWNGPMSVSVYIDNLGVFERVVRAFAVCNVGALSKVRFHMVRPLRERASRHFDHFRVADFSSPSMLCDGLRALLELHQGANYEEAEYPYPSNLLRNVAHTASRTDYVLHVDIDLLPSRHLRARFNRFAASSQPGDLTVAYVLPVFEVDSTTEFPDDEQQVAAWVDRGAARPFYWQVCPRCQNRTDYVRWLALSSSPSDTCRAVYDVHWEWSYEPFYVSRRLSLPAFDERFRRYGYNRASHLCELHVAGTTFRVLHPLFLTHLGFKRNFHPRKREEQRANRVRYAHFIAGLKVKYPASNRTCEEQPLYSLL